MPSNIQVLPIGDRSDGTGSTPANATGISRNDGYYLERIAERWAHDRSMSPAFTYRLDRLPTGYAGFEKQRSDKSTIDRYLYGHPKGVFRSVNELYPHFKYLQEGQPGTACSCKLCKSQKAVHRFSGSSTSETIEERSKYFPDASDTKRALPLGKTKPTDTTASVQQVNKPLPPLPAHGNLPEGRYDSDSSQLTRKKQVDANGNQDIYRALFDKLEEAGEDGYINEDITEFMSPDWRAGHQQLNELLQEWRIMPNYVPRVGEVVLFARNEDDLAWNPKTSSFSRVDLTTKTWLEPPKWEAGVVTQMPVQKLAARDLIGVAPGSTQSLAYAGFRIEPLLEATEKKRKSVTVQHKYVPLHRIRPFTYWKQCLGGVDEKAWHPSIKAALSISNSFCLLARYAIKGRWPEATVFVKGLYIGAELILVGDAVRLLPKPAISKQERAHSITDMMIVSSIQLCFLDLDEASDDDYDRQKSYTICLHIQGRPYTLDAKRCFDGRGQALARPGVDFSNNFAGYGTWYHVLDPQKPGLRLEIPFTRILGRCYEYPAPKAWFATPKDLPVPSYQPSTSPTKEHNDFIRGSEGISFARQYSLKNNPRIDRAGGKAWFWADSRIEQLDLHEVNNRFVGVHDETRNKAQMNAWRKALKVLDGQKGGLEEYHAARVQQKAEVQAGVASGSSAYGMVASGSIEPQEDSEDESDDGEEVEVAVASKGGVKDEVEDDDDDDVMSE